MSTGSLPFDPAVPCHPPVPGHPAWDVALLYPPQGQWSEEQYLTLTDHARRLVEYTDGQIEVLSVPTLEHQRILKFLLWALDLFVTQNKLGEVLPAGTRVFIDPKKYREPDVVFCSTARLARTGTRYYDGADLVMEIVSEDPASQQRDLEQKPSDSAEGGVPEYWIVDPQLQKVTVLTLQDGRYVEHGAFVPGDLATSKRLPEFVVSVTDVFAAAKPAA